MTNCARERKMMSKIIKIEECDFCPECGQHGKMERIVENCSCHIVAPCSACESDRLVCNCCGLEVFDGEYEELDDA